jgi:Flp pilus assembly pilin Flp
MSMPSFVARLCRANSKYWPIVVRFIVDDGGQDIVEYAFIAAFIGVAGWAAVMAIDEAVGATYTSWQDPAVGVPSLWEPPEPSPSGS